MTGPSDRGSDGHGLVSGLGGLLGLGLGDLGASAVTVTSAVPWMFAALLAVLLVFVNVAPNSWEFRFRPTRRMALVTAVMVTWSLLLLTAPSPFLYFQF